MLTFCVLASVFVNASLIFAASFDLNEDLTLGLSLAADVGGNYLDNLAAKSVIVRKALADDITGEFSATEYAIAQLEGHIQSLYQRLQMGPDSLLRTKLDEIGGSEDSMSEFSAKLIEELDYIASTYWTGFKPLMTGIITNILPNLQTSDLAFRCDRTNELNSLRKLGWTSQLYQATLGIFFSELYTHCLTRKLVLVELNHIRPGSLVRQFVDIYLDLPPSSQTTNPASIDKILKGAGAHFNPEEAMQRHGNIKAVSQFVIDPKAGLTMSSASGVDDKSDLINRFKEECKLLITQLVTIWSGLDQVASLLTSPMNNLVAWDEQAKQLVPELVYGTICYELSNRS